MFPVGLVLGLGFDTGTEFGTATEAALMVMAGSGAAGSPWYAIVWLPLLFAAGMSLFGTLDGTFMNFACQWAFSSPVRKVFCNLAISGLSIAVGFLIVGLFVLVRVPAIGYGRAAGGEERWSAGSTGVTLRPAAGCPRRRGRSRPAASDGASPSSGRSP